MKQLARVGSVRPNRSQATNVVTGTGVRKYLASSAAVRTGSYTGLERRHPVWNARKV